MTNNDVFRQYHSHSFSQSPNSQPRFNTPLAKKSFSQSYSRFVNLMKYLLPSTAVILVVSVFVWPSLNPDDLKFQLGFSNINIGIGGQPSMINPRYHSEDEKNQRYSVTADLAKRLTQSLDSKNSEILKLEMPKADIMMKDGTWLVLTAKSGVFSKQEGWLDLLGKVNLFHDSGFEVRTQKARIDLENGMAKGVSPVEGQGPFGNLRGEGFKLIDKGKTIVFTGKSQLTIHPDAGNTIK